MTGRERIQAALHHKTADRIPVDFGSTPVTGVAVSIVAELRQALDIDTAGTPVKIIEPGFQA